MLLVFAFSLLAFLARLLAGFLSCLRLCFGKNYKNREQKKQRNGKPQKNGVEVIDYSRNPQKNQR